MFRFSLLALMSTVVAAAVACAVLFVFPPWLRASALFVGVLAIPGPLYVLYRNGGFAGRSFALGGLVAYAAWFIIVGVPGGFGVVTSSTQLNLGSVSSFTDQPFVGEYRAERKPFRLRVFRHAVRPVVDRPSGRFDFVGGVLVCRKSLMKM